MSTRPTRFRFTPSLVARNLKLPKVTFDVPPAATANDGDEESTETASEPDPMVITCPRFVEPVGITEFEEITPVAVIDVIWLLVTPIAMVPAAELDRLHLIVIVFTVPFTTIIELSSVKVGVRPVGLTLFEPVLSTVVPSDA